jgi:hypothetical protein
MKAIGVLISIGVGALLGYVAGVYVWRYQLESDIQAELDKQAAAHGWDLQAEADKQKQQAAADAGPGNKLKLKFRL